MKRKQMAVVPLDTAIKVMADYCKRNAPSFEGNAEFRAAVTHWLHHSELHHPFFPVEMWRKRDLLAAFIVDSALISTQLSNEAEAQLCLDWGDIPYPPPKDSAFTFIDLFAGIGGFRIAMQECNGTCVFSCEWDKYAKQTYFANFGEVPFGDIRNIEAAAIPDHDILCAGFPCQPFSLAGVSKKNSLGRKHGFEDKTQGTLFFDIARILRDKRPKAFFLENVKNMLNHDDRKTFEVIRYTLEDELEYVIEWSVVDGANWMPQHRERVFIVGYDPEQIKITRNEINIPKVAQKGYQRPELRDIIQHKVDSLYTLGLGTWATLERHKKHHAAAGHGFGYSLHTLPIPKYTGS